MNIFSNIINDNQFFMDPYFAIWRILKMNKKYRILIDFSFLMIKVAHNSDVGFEEWIKCYILYSKALFLDNKLDEALELLRGLLDIFTNIPLDEIKYVSEIHKQNKISLKNNFFDFENLINYYSKYHIYSKCEAIFKRRMKKKENNFFWNIKEEISPNKDKSFNLLNKISKSLIEEDDYLNDQDDYKSRNLNDESCFQKKSTFIDQNKSDTLYLNEENRENKNVLKKFEQRQSNYESIKIYDNSNSKEKNMKDTGINSFEKLENFIFRKIKEIEIKKENTCKIIINLVIIVISNPKILYQMGKICAKSNSKLEMGLLCLSDYIKILKFENNYELGSTKCYKKSMAIFFQGVIFCLLKQYKNADACFKKRNLNEDLQKKPIRNDFRNLFFEFYRIFLVREIEFVFDINKLKDL